MYFTGRPTTLLSIPASTFTRTAQNFDPKLPPAGCGIRSSLFAGIFIAFASRNRKFVRATELAWIVIIPVPGSKLASAATVSSGCPPVRPQ